MPEAHLEDLGSGLTPVTEGWFVVNVRDAEWWFSESRGARCAFENEYSVLSGYFSFSFSAPHLFGDRVEDFAGEVRKLLTSRSPEGVFWDWPGDTEVVVARKPG